MLDGFSMKPGVGQTNALAAEKLARHTVRPCTPCATAPEQRPSAVILVPPCTDLAPGFEMARARVVAGETVRLVGMGVTQARAWPSWVADTPGLWLTELAAYRSTTRWEATRALRDGLRELCDELFDGAVRDLRGSELFYPHIGLRSFASIAFVMPIAIGLAEQHHREAVVCTRTDWPGFVLYRALTGQPPQVSRARWVARVAVLAAAGWALSLARVAVMYAQSRAGLDELARRAGDRQADLWLQLSPDMPRANAALVEATRGRDVGVLLHGHIGRGERDEVELKVRRGQELWPGLRGLDRRRVAVWETTSIPSSFVRFGVSCLRFTTKSARSAARLCRHGPLLRVGGYPIDMTPHAGDLARLLTMDMARVCMADEATTDVLRKHDFRGATILSIGAVPADVALVMRRLRSRGATTIDFSHGWSGEPEPFTQEPPCDYQCVWIHTDAADGDVRFVIGGMPRPPRLERGRRLEGDRERVGGRIRVLVMTSYMHRDDVVYQRGYEPYLDEILEVVRRRSDRYDFRWRPHPADLPESIARAAAGLPAELSQGRPLHDDLAWADVVVSTRSTAIATALLVGLPVLVHMTPDVEDGPLADPYSPDRMFFRGSEGVEKLDRIVAGLSGADPLAPENRTRAFLFGESGSPATLAQALVSLPRPVVRRLVS